MRFAFVLLSIASFAATGAELSKVPLAPVPDALVDHDWLIHDTSREAGVYRSADGKDLILSNGLVRRVFRLAPNAATIAIDNLSTGGSLLRGVKPEARITIDGQAFDVGGLKGQPNYAFLLPEWVDTLTADPNALQFTGFDVGEPQARMEWKQVRHHAPDAVWPPKGVALRMDYALPGNTPPITVSVHYELYDGIPLFSKWITVHNTGSAPVTVDTFTNEIIAAVEGGSDVDAAEPTFIQPPGLLVETDYAMNGMTAIYASRWSVHWVPDPDYETQVNYQRMTPCLLEVRPELGPAAVVAPGDTFSSFRAFVMPLDGTDRERNGLAHRRLYRTVAPWVTENPLMMHVRHANPKTVENAIDQCAEVGFEMVILTFGSGFDIENDTDKYVAQMKEYADYAAAKGIEIGGYSLLASRSIDAENDVFMPEGQTPTFGHSPCIGSPWGEGYFKKLYSFFETTGFDLLEHDGSYPGDPCTSTAHPGHRGHEDSRWSQWRTITHFYQWCRARGVYLNVPDFYYLAGSNKSGMGYRETNWSLPRAQQVIHTRQNIFDGTWEKTPSMGWMFVPLTEYHGGGEAATIEPLDEHLDHYERMLLSNLALGVQACYRGPRLYDTDRTRDMLQQRIAWYKAHRDILESDMIHGRRADGRDLDWMLHVNPRLEEKGMLVVFNPLKEPVTRAIDVDVYYTGLQGSALVQHESEAPVAHAIVPGTPLRLEVTVPAEGKTYSLLRATE
jgi:hypothetical protein